MEKKSIYNISADIAESLQPTARNVPFTAVESSGVVMNIPEGFDVTVKDPVSGKVVKFKTTADSYIVNASAKKKTLFSGRYCAVSAFVFAFVNGRFCVLANKRGEGAPDFKHCWNCPCGYLEVGEDAKHGAAREILEETGVYVNPDILEAVFTQTEPEECENGNVTIRHYAYLGEVDPLPENVILRGGEKNEVEAVAWISVQEVKNRKWAFGHEKTIFLLKDKWPWPFCN